MNEVELRSILLAHPVTSRAFKGIFARDEIVKVSRDAFIIVNTDARNQPGSHWVLCFGDLYFDSFGLPPLYPEFCHMKTFNKQQLQDESSSLCGIYCIYFALKLCLGETLQDIRSRFSSNTKFNDRIICTLFKKHFSYFYHPCSVCMKCTPLC